MRPAHPLHRFRVDDPGQRLFSDPAHGLPAEHVALAAGMHIAVVPDVQRPAPQVVAGARAICGQRACAGGHDAGFIIFDAHQVDPFNRAPELPEVLDLRAVALQPDQLRHELHG